MAKDKYAEAENGKQNGAQNGTPKYDPTHSNGKSGSILITSKDNKDSYEVGLYIIYCLF